MADSPSAVPSFVSAMARAEDAKAVLAYQHPEYSIHASTWQALIDAFEGGGGFLSGTYLWRYPREDGSEFKSRQEQARYHNYLEPLIDLYARFIFTQGVKRSSRSEALNAWLEDVDGTGTDITALMKRALALSLVAGHVGVLVDKTADEPVGPAQADDLGRVVARVFNALAIPDWRFSDDTLTSVKLVESAPEPGITDAMTTAPQYLFWAEDGWARFDAEGVLLAAGLQSSGRVPLVLLRPKPSYTSLMLGRPLCGNANILKAILNRDAEEDEVLRAQAFSVLTVSVPEGGNVTQAKEQLGSVIGAAKALVVQGEISYQTPDQSVPGAIRENRAYLVQELYRAAHVRLKAEGLQAESGDSIRLQYTELNEALQGIAKWLAQAEHQIARHWFGWTSASPEAAEAAYTAAQVEVTYPSEFFLDDLLTDLEAWAEALRMDLGPTMQARIKRKAVRRIDPDIPGEELALIDADIDEAAKEPAVTPGPVDTGDPEAELLAAAARDADAA